MYPLSLCSILRRGDAKGVLEGAREIGGIVIGTQSRHVGDIELGMVVEQVPCPAHPYHLYKCLWSVASDGREALPELVRTQVKACRHTCRINLSITNKLVYHIYCALKEVLVGIG